MSQTKEVGLVLQSKELRRRAQEILANRSQSQPAVKLDQQKLIEEFSIYQVELELQNEELRRTQTHLQEFNDQMKLLFEHAPVGYVVLNASGQITKVNQTFATMLDLDAGLIRHRTFGQFVSSQHKELFLGAYRSLFANPKAHKLELALDNGHTAKELVVSVTANRIKEDELLVTLTDITAQVKAHRDLDQIFALSHDILCVCDFDFKVIRANPAFLNLLQMPEAELLGCSLSNQIHPLDQQAWFAMQARLQKGHTTPHLDNRILNALDEPTWLSWSAVPDTNRRQIFMVAQNITIRKAQEEALQLSQQAAQEAVKVKQEFLATMSHEIRTPLNGVVGMTYLLDSTPLNPQQKHYTDMLRSCGEGLVSVINGILDFSKLEAGRMEPHPVPVDLLSLVDELLDIFHLKCLSKRLELVVSLSPDLPEWVVLDPVMLKQVLINLVGNGVKFTEEGMVKVELELRQSQEQNWLVGRVRDTGVGISARHQAKLFEPFYQVEGSQAKEGGTGLGLAISKKMLDLMGGSITLESSPGRGSLFEFSIPVSLGGIPAKLLKNIQGMQGKRLALVNLLPAREDYLVELFTRAGAQVLQGGENNPPEPGSLDLLIYDCRDSRRPWSEINEWLGQRYQPAPPLLLLTFESSLPQQNAGIQALHKPFSLSKLLQSCMDLLDHQHEEKPSPGTWENLGQALPLRVLVAEDNQNNLFYLQSLLSAMGFCPDVVSNGQQVLALLGRQAYDLVFMDIKMPEMDGIETTRQIRKLDLEIKPVIIAYSAYALSQDRERAFAAGMDDFLPKPVVPDMVAQMILKWAAGRASSNA